MQRLVLASFAALAATASAAGASPVGKVLQLLSDLEAKIIKEGESAQSVYAEYSEWCEDRARELAHEIKTGDSQVAQLQAAIADNEASAQASAAKIEDLAAAIATDEADLKAATEIRAGEEKDFRAEEAELTETISMLERATGILERELAKGSSSLLQSAKDVAAAFAAMVQASMMSSADAQRLSSLMQTSEQDADDDVGAPAAAVYESHSSNIVDTLQSLLEKAQAQLAEARKKETTNVHNFELLEQSIRDELKFGNKDLVEAKNALAASREAKATAEGDLDVASKELKDDSKSKGELHQDCMAKAEDFEAETKSRGEELKALAEAKKVLAAETGGATSIAYGGAAFLQVARSQLATSADLRGFEAVRLVRDLARRERSGALAQLARRMASAGRSGTSDPFSKVKGLIVDMIGRLEAEHAADTTRKEHCDKELAETHEKKAEKTAEIEKLTVRVDRATASSSKLKAEAAELQQQLAKLAAAQAEMDKLRSSEHEAFVENKADMEQGLEGVKTALRILNEYYARDGKAHGAAEGAGAGIIGLLEVVESDFSKSLAEIQATEDSAAAAYDRETKDNDVERAAKTTAVEHSTKEFKYLDREVATISADRGNVQAELDSILEYLSSLQGQCTDTAESYADRKAHREAEIQGLKEALRTLETETALVQTTHRSFRGVARHTA